MAGLIADTQSYLYGTTIGGGNAQNGGTVSKLKKWGNSATGCVTPTRR
jgi:hypothetical protein